MRGALEKINRLQQDLARAREAEDKDREIQYLIEIAKHANQLQDFGLENLHLSLAAREIQISGYRKPELHQVLGDRALLMRRAKRNHASLTLYQQAAAAAEETNNPRAQAVWTGKQGHIHRLEKRWEQARACYRQAHARFSALGDEGLAGLADQEGNLGLLAQALDDPNETLRRYRRAVELSEQSGDPELLATWMRNYANELSRRRFYARARAYYAKAYAAMLEAGDEEQIYGAAMAWSSCEARAHRREASAKLLLATVEKLTQPRFILPLLESALVDLQLLGRRDSMRSALAKVDQLANSMEIPKKMFSGFRSYIDYNDHLDAELSEATGNGSDDDPTVLEIYLTENMSAAQDAGDVDRFKEIGELLCDVNSALTSPSDAAWARFLQDPSLRYRVVAGVTQALVSAERLVESLELSQRFKGAGFRLAALQELRKRKQRTQREESFLAAQSRLEKAIEPLAQRRIARPLALVENVRAAGEQLLEAGALLKEIDRTLAARLGGLVRPSELIDATPVNDPVVMCDFITGPGGSTVHILLREGSSVQLYGGVLEEFTWEHYGRVLGRLIDGGFLSEISLRQREALLAMGKELHDRFLCGLAKHAREKGVTQFVLIPDAFLQSLPLGLSWVCGQELRVPGVTQGDENFFAEIFPHEYASCLQSIAVSQHQKRPRAVTKVLSVADTRLDLPGAFYASEALRESVGDAVTFVSLPREQATIGRFLAEARDADIIVLGAHGEFNANDPLRSRLALHDGDWTLEDMQNGEPFERSPVVILNACEVGAVRPASDAVVSGIPGALISAGAACVVASSWPVIDIAAGYLQACLIRRLQHPGHRPAAHLFRALRDLRTWKKDDILDHTARVLTQMEEDGSAERFPNEFIQVDHFYDLIDRSDDDHPLSAPEIWGGIAVYGSGWSAPAGAYVGPNPAGIAEVVVKRQAISARLDAGEIDDNAIAQLDEFLQFVEGEERARLLELKAQLVWREGATLCPRSDRAEALELLSEARFTAQAEQNEQLVRNIEATRKKILL